MITDFRLPLFVPRPIVAAAIAVHTDCSGAPLGSFSVVFKA